LDDVEKVSTVIDSYYRRIELKELVPESLNEFGYVGKHYILAFPEDLFADSADRTKHPQFFELQIKTLFQHAWSEAEHDLGYKPEEPLTPLQHRQVAFTAAQAWGADHLFSTLHGELQAKGKTG
jgi:ppGpp synthetase/RelA/SpoT-type nucleotidyltranferase